jgi:hypothetical protein
MQWIALSTCTDFIEISAIFSLFFLSEDRRMDEGRSTIPEFQGHLEIDKYVIESC